MTDNDPLRRIVLDHCSDPYTKLPAGTRGTIRLVDSVGTVHVDWDNGSKLGLIPGEDRWHYEEQT